MHFFSKRTKAIVASLIATSLVLVGCSRGEGEKESTQGTKENRVVSLGLGDVDTLLALGITPVAIAPWESQDLSPQSGVGPWSQPKLGNSNPEKIFDTGQGITAQVIEKVTAANPSQIIAVNQAVDAQAKESLEKIAPTTLKPEGFKDWQIPWDKQVETIAKAVGKQAEGEQLIEETKGSLEKFKQDHPKLQGKRVAVVSPYDGKISVLTSGDGRGQFVENLGFTIPKELQGDGSSFYVTYAPENYSKLNDVDYLFVLDYHGDTEALKKDKAFQNLVPVKDGRVHYLDTNLGNAMSMPNPVTIPWAVQQFEGKFQKN